jgi:CMP-2-keto-3-deoxyoctulosonic acid synthetase
LDEVYVATDDERIKSMCLEHKMNVIMTSKTHQTGTDRVAEVARNIKADLYLNIQGDEPLIEPLTISKAIEPFLNNSTLQVTNLMTKIENPVDAINTTIPKVVTNSDNIGIYLSRSIIPFPKGNLDYCYFKQVCVYGYKPEALELFS